jgi:hypothetical protein
MGEGGPEAESYHRKKKKAWPSNNDSILSAQH